MPKQESISRLELQYTELMKKVEELAVRVPQVASRNEHDESLGQPSFLKIVETTTTYGTMALTP